jgi:uncharacterized repeat protein (TIGR03806 family)
MTRRNGLERVWPRIQFALAWVMLAASAVSTKASDPTTKPLPGAGADRGGAGERRVPWTGSKFAGTPDPPPPYAVELAFPHLKFDFPVVLVRAKGTHRLFLGDLRGRVYSFPEERDCKKADRALELGKVYSDFSALYGLTFHPDFDKNRFVYLCYVRRNDTPDGSIVSRFTVSRTDPPVIDPKSEQVILKFYSGGHNGGCLEFGNDGDLYISTGDAAAPSPPDVMMTGQDCSDLLSSVLRIDVDHAETGKAYRIPPDNPFVNMPGVRPEIWAFGFRNPWKMTFDRATGDLWVGDVGWELWELVFKAKRGGNYGWSVMEGPQPVNVEARRGPAPISPPLKAHPHSEAASITGGFVYHGTRLPELAGAYVYGDYQSGIIWGLRNQGETVTWQRELARTPLHLVAFGENHEGELYLVDHDRTHQIYRLVPNTGAKIANDFPRRLSQTGLFSSTRNHQPAPGVVPYSINAPLWSDRATAERFLAVPGDGRIELDNQGVWRLPQGSVLARTVSIEPGPGQPGHRRRVETQILHLEADAWRPYSYFWSDDQTDAELVGADGLSRTIALNEPGGQRELNYRVHARTECGTCHNPWVEKKTTVFGVQSASPLGVNTAQLNRKCDNGSTSVNQLAKWHQAGLLAWKPDLATLPKLVDPYDESVDLDRRARSYLQTNCAHCHQINAGGTATIVLGYDQPLEQTRTVNIRPIQGTFNIAGARIIAPGDPASSVLYYRMSKLGGGRMPRVGSNVVDERATRMIHDWIARMPPAPAAASADARDKTATGDRDAVETLLRADQLSPPDRSAAIGRLMSSTRGALLLLSMIDRGQASPTLRRDVVAVARKSPLVEVRDLFERFIPEAERIKRLGDVVDRAAILALRGDAGRGRLIFTGNAAAQCKTCHKAGGFGENVGPDLTKIGTKYNKAAMLGEILEPSKTIEPQYATYLLETKDGRVLSGLAVERTKDGVVLKDAQGKTVKVASTEIDRLVPQTRSLMPELLLRDLTAQQVADLLEFLMSLR